MARIFLDANVIFSGANKAGNLHRFILRLMKGHELISSEYARQEALRNVLAKRPQWEEGCQMIIPRITIVPGTDQVVETCIAEKDRPILATAITEKCDFLITGDKRDFGHLFGQKVGSVLIVTPLVLARMLTGNRRVDGNDR